MSTARVTVSFPPDLIRGIDRLEKNRSKFIQDAVRHELERRRREKLHLSIENPHPESRELAELGLEDWATGVPEAAVDGLLDPEEGIALSWNSDEGWREGDG